MLTAFKTYLQLKDLNTSSIKMILHYAKVFERWLNTQNLPIKDLTYEWVMQYINDLRDRDLAHVTILHYVRYLRHYGDYLVKKGILLDNPVAYVRLRSTAIKRRSPLPPLLENKDLDKLYTIYNTQKRYSLQNKVLLGLLIYQGIAVGELAHIRIKDVDLQACQLLIPTSGNYQSRDLDLASCQMLFLSNWLKDKGKNDLLINYTNKHQGSSSRYRQSLQIKRILKKEAININYIKLGQIRSSRIALWIKQYGLRKAQYLAGHKHISSTERYEEEDLSALSAAIATYHPLNK